MAERPNAVGSTLGIPLSKTFVYTCVAGETFSMVAISGVAGSWRNPGQPSDLSASSILPGTRTSASLRIISNQ